jgi:hypothetical protein
LTPRCVQQCPRPEQGGGGDDVAGEGWVSRNHLGEIT